MNSVYTIVVPNNDIVRLCGSNDINLKLIEESLGVSIFTRGNEISVQESDVLIQERFKYIIDRLLDEIDNGNMADTHLVQSILNTKIEGKNLTEQDRKQLFSQSSIHIPMGKCSVYPKTQSQAELVQAMRNYDMVFCIGPAGSGKTFLMVAEALNLVMQHKKSKIILTRPVVEAGESLGFLPGDLEQKISPYLRPLYDAMEMLLPRDQVKKLVENGVIEIAPLAYMRGRTLADSVVILDEAQNTTTQQMKMFLTRMGENSKVFVTGDVTQIDLPKRFESGLKQGVHILRNIEEIKIIHFNSADVVRNALVRKIVQAYEAHE